jgi:hypothetical protein
LTYVTGPVTTLPTVRHQRGQPMIKFSAGAVAALLGVAGITCWFAWPIVVFVALSLLGSK